MTVATVTFIEAMMAEVEAAFASTAAETVAFGFANRVRGRRRHGLIVTRVEQVPSEAYLERSSGLFSLDPSYVAEVSMRALEAQRSLVIMHSHPGWDSVPSFSPIDERMHGMLVPSLLRRLRSPVGSMVWSPGGWSGRLWTSPEESEFVSLIRIAGAHLRMQWRDDPPVDERPFDRQIRAFGRPAQRVLGSLRLGVGGAGGTGSMFVEGAAHLGVREFVVVEPDVLEASNLSRVLGSRPADVGMPKALIVERQIRSIAPTAVVELVQEVVQHCDALAALRDCDVLVACTDSHGSRAFLNRVAYQFAIPLLDVASLLRLNDGRTEAFAEVRLAGPGLPCLRCQGALASDRVTLEGRAPEERAELERLGYAPGHDAPDPSVLPLNGLAVSLGLLRLLDVIEPWLRWEQRVTIEASQLRVVERAATGDPACDVCGPAAAVGAGDDVAIDCRRSLG